MSSVREKVVEKSRFLKHFRFCASCLTIGAVPLLRLSRNRESANVKVLYFVGSDQKCGTKFSACRAHWWQKKKKKQFFLFFSFQHYEKKIVSQAVHHNPSGKYASRCWAKRKWLHILWQTIPEVRTNRVERKHSAEKYDNQSMKFTHSAVGSSPFYPWVSLKDRSQGKR